MAESADGTRKTVLVVDDEAVVRDLISGFLGKLGYKVEVAEDGPDALRVFESLENPPSVMVTDIVMPHMDGPTLAGTLRKSHPALCVLFVSSYDSKKLSVSELTKPQNGFLSKPFSLRSFAASVAKLIKVAEDS